MPSFPHPKWETIPPYTLYNLAPRAIVERGLGYFLNKKVHSLVCSPEDGTIFAEVQGKTTYEVTLKPKLDNTIEHACTCPAWFDRGYCKHVAAATAALFYLIHGSTYGDKPPSADYASKLRASLFKRPDVRVQSLRQATKGLVPASTLLEKQGPLSEDGASEKLSLRVANDGSLSLELEAGPQLSGGLRQLLDQYPLLRTSDRAYRADYRNYPQAVTPLIVDAIDLGISCELHFSQGILNLSAPVVRADLVSAFAIKAERAVEHMMIPETPEGFLDPLLLVLANEPLGITQSGQLFLMNDMPSRKWPIIYGTAKDWEETHGAPQTEFKHTGDPALSTDDQRLPTLNAFNAAALEALHSDNQWNSETLLLIDHTGHKQFHSPRQLPIEDSLRLAINLSRDVKNNLCTCSLDFLHEGEVVKGDALIDAIDIAIEDFLPNRRLLASKKRFSLLHHVLLTLFRSSSSHQLSEAHQTLEEAECFSSPDQRADAKYFINCLFEQWNQADKQAIFANPHHDPCWQRLKIDQRQFALTLLALFPDRRETGFRFAAVRQLPLDKAFSAILGRATFAAGLSGAEIFVDGKPVTRERVNIALAAEDDESDDRIDWFELKPEVQCGKFTIESGDWARLLRGELILEGKDGNILVPELPETALLAYLEKMQDRAQGGRKGSRKGRASLKIHRLQMLEWIELRKQGADVRFPDYVERSFQQLMHLGSLPPGQVPKSITATLRSYQKEAVAWLEFLYTHRFGACLADDMGLGKTIQAITFLARLKELYPRPSATPRPHLVVMPTSLIFNWQNELRRFCPGLTVSEYTGTHRNWETAAQADVVLTTYDTLRLDKNRISHSDIDVLILDETQAAKSLSSARYKALRQIKPRFTLCMTGTPLENNVSEYFAIMNLAVPGVFGTYREFAVEFKQDPQRILARVRPFILRRTKNQILKELPPKQESDIYLEMTEVQKEYYTRTVAEVRDEVYAAFDDKTVGRAGIVALAALIRLRQTCVAPEMIGKGEAKLSPKFRYLMDTLQSLNAEGHSVLVFSSFATALRMLVSIAAENGLPHLHLDGSTPIAQRKKNVEAFQASTAPNNFFISLKAGGSGLNLTKASHVIHLDPWWNPAAENQASDRAHRIGQTQHVFIQRLIMRHTIEEKIMLLKNRKRALFEQMIDHGSQHGNQASGAISKDDFAFLLGEESDLN